MLTLRLSALPPALVAVVTHHPRQHGWRYIGATGAGSCGFAPGDVYALAAGPGRRPGAGYSTIVPVLFLALAVQSRGYENLMKALDALQRRLRHATGWSRRAALAAGMVLVVAASLILVYALLSEILAIYALYQEQARSSTGQNVLTGLIILIIATVTGPVLTFLKYYSPTGDLAAQ